MARFTRRATLAALGAGAVVSIGYALRGILGSPVLSIRLTDGGGMMGASPADMSLYMDMFNRHNEITRTVEEIPGGIRTTTPINCADLVAQLQAHVSSMQGRVRARAAESYDTVLGVLGFSRQMDFGRARTTACRRARSRTRLPPSRTGPGHRVAACAATLARIPPGLLRRLRPRPRRQQHRSGLSRVLMVATRFARLRRARDRHDARA